MTNPIVTDPCRRITGGLRVCVTACLLLSGWLCRAAVSPEYRGIEKGIERVNVARFDQITAWQASDGIPPGHDGAKVLDGEVCDASGRYGYWAGKDYRLPVTMELAFPRPTPIDANVIIWYTPEIRGVGYKLEGLRSDGEWFELYAVRGNRYRDRVHRFQPATVTKVRFTLEKAAGQNRVVMREFLLYEGLMPKEEKVLMSNAVKCLGPNERSKVVDLGVAVKAVVYGNSQGTVGPNPEGGRPVFYTSFYQSGGGELLAYDHGSKKSFRWDLSGTSGGYGVTTGLDGRIYVGTVEGRNGGHLFQFDPKSQTMRDLGSAGQPTSYVWACATSPDGKIFGAGYPKCIPLIYDPKTGKLTSPGSISPRPGTDYLRSVAADAKGRAWFGVGTKAALVVYDPADGSHRNVLPEKYAGESQVYSLVRAGNRIYALILFSGKVLVFDADSCEFIREVPVPPNEKSLMVTVSDLEGNVYCRTGPSGHLCVIRPGSARAEQLAPFLGSPKSLLADRYLHVIFDNDHRIYDLQTRQVIDEGKWIEPKAGMGIYTLTQGPGGKVYGSTYINQHFFRCDPASGKLEDLGLIIRSGGQCDSICCSRDGRRLWMGCYAAAYLVVYDPTQPYKLGTDPDCNPRDFGPVGKGQYRTKDIVEGPLGKIYVGSVPSYRSAPTGAFTIFDPKTLNKNVMTDFVPGGTVHCLAANDRFVYGSGGGKLFILDPKAEQKVKELALGCTALLIAPDGTLVVATSQDVQGLDPNTLGARWSIPFSQVEGLKAFHRMVAHAHGELYGISNLGLFRVDVETSKLVQLTTSASRHLAADKAGRLYFSQGASLCVYEPGER